MRNNIYPTQLIIRRGRSTTIQPNPIDTGLITGIYERAALRLRPWEGNIDDHMIMGIDRFVFVGVTPTPVRTLFIPFSAIKLIRNTIHVNIYNATEMEWDVLGYDYSIDTTLDVVEEAWEGYNKYRKLSERPYKLFAAEALEALYRINPGAITSSNVNNILNVKLVENRKVLEISPGANFPAANENIKIYF